MIIVTYFINEFDMKKIAIIDMKDMFSKTVRMDMRRNVEIALKKQYYKIIWFILLISVVFFIGHQIGRDAANRDYRLNSKEIEKNNQ